MDGKDTKKMSIPELKKEKQEFQDKRYEHYEKRRPEAIDQARQIRTKMLNDETEQDQENGGTSTGFRKAKNDDNKKMLNKTEKIVLELLKKNSNVTRQDLAVKIAKNIKTVQRTLDSLELKGYIQKKGKTRAVKWVLNM